MINRRMFVAGSAGAMVVATLGKSAFAQTGSEAPAIKQLVDAGKLPALADRLPKSPLVVQPTESVGAYGGTWRFAMIGGADEALDLHIGYVRLVRWNLGFTDVVPDIAESVTKNDTASEFVFKLREGLKWSDGAPFDADGIMFWYKDILLNREVTPSTPAWLKAGGEVVTVEKLGPYEVAFKFKEPSGLFLANLATMRGADLIAGCPAHYLKKFHKDHNAGGIDALVKEAGVNDWVQLISNKILSPSRWRDIDRPVLGPWKLVTPYTGTASVEAERNPYFFKVDPEGRQLPYIDRVEAHVVQDQQAVVLKAVNGELDMQSQYVDLVSDRPVIVQHQEKADYKLFVLQPAYSNTLMINLNQTHKDPKKRAMFAKRDFRVGLSYAINREELNQLIYAGVSRPYQAAPRPDTRLYDEELATQFTEFNVELANKHLDMAGLVKRDGQNFRVDDSGERASFAIEVVTSERLKIDALERIKAYLANVGVEMVVRPGEQSLIEARMQSNEHDAIAWQGGGGYDMLGLIDPKWYFPYEYKSSYATACGIYFQDPKSQFAEQPTDAMKRQQDLYRQILQTPELDKQLDLMKQILQITKEEFYIIGTTMEPDAVGVVRSNMRNVPALMPKTYFYVTPGPTNPEQYYYAS